VPFEHDVPLARRGGKAKMGDLGDLGFLRLSRFSNEVLDDL
jgi:hypothetical protein